MTMQMQNKKVGGARVPALRFPEFSGEWDEKELGEIFAFGKTNSLSRDDLTYDSGETYNIHYGDIHTKFKSHFRFKNEVIPFIKGNTDIDPVMPGDLIVADASEDYKDIGKTIEIIDTNGKFIVSGLHTLLLRKKNKGASGFFGFVMQSRSVRLQIMRVAQGIKVLGLSRKYLNDVLLGLPSLSEQQKIAEFLGAVDEKIEQLSKKKASLETYKKGVMQKIFSQELRFKDENGNSYPDWEEKRLGEVAEITTGSSNREDSTERGKYVFFDRSMDIRSSSIFLFDSEAIIIAGEGLDFKPRYFSGKFDLHQRAYAIMKKSSDIDWKFLFYSIFSTRHYFSRMAVGSTMPSLRLPIFKKMLVSFPRFSEQQKIADLLTSLDKKISAISCQLDRVKDFKKGLLQQMFV